MPYVPPDELPRYRGGAAYTLGQQVVINHQVYVAAVAIGSAPTNPDMSKWTPVGAGGSTASATAPTRIPLSQQTIASDGTFNTFPSGCATADGRILLLYRTGPDLNTGPGSTVKKRFRNTDGTLSGASTVFSPTGMSGGVANIDIGQPCVACAMASGTIIAAVAQNSDVAGTVITSWFSKSTDNGATFAALAQFPNAFHAGSELQNVTSMVQLDDGNVLAALYGSDRVGPWNLQDFYVRFSRSTDSGVTFPDIGVALKPDAVTQAGWAFAEPCICQLPPRPGESHGRILLTMRVYDASLNESVWAAWSADRGATWTTPVQILALADALPRAVVSADGDVVMLTRHYSLGRAFFVVSADQGATWGKPQPLCGTRSTSDYGQPIVCGPAGQDNNVAIFGCERSVLGAGGSDAFLWLLSRPYAPGSQGGDLGGPLPLPAVRKLSGPSYKDLILQRASCISMWPLDEPLGADVAFDARGVNPGAITGPVINGQQSLALDGHPATLFSAVGGCVTVAASASITAALTGSFTWECLVCPDAAAIASGGVEVFTEQGFGVYLQVWSTKLHYAFNGGSTDLASAVIAAGAVHHVACRKDLGTSKVALFVDGVKVDEHASVAHSAASGLYLGAAGNTAGNYSGLIQDISLDNVALSDATIAADSAFALARYVTGSRAANAALASLISALKAAGIPLVDLTT